MIVNNQKKRLSGVFPAQARSCITKTAPALTHRNGSIRHYLGECYVCITILNPYSDSKMFIDLEDEFTLTYGAYHSHFFADTGEYEEMVKEIQGLLKNEICSAALYYGTDKKWLGSTSIPKDDINKPFKEIFSFVMKKKEFKSKLRSYGGEVQYIFWNPSDNRTIQIPAKYSE